MTALRLQFVLVNVVGGLAVLASYAIGLASPTTSGGALWGGVPQALRPVYAVSMLTATVGYFCFTGFVLLRVPTIGIRFFGRHGFGFLNGLYAAVLAASALWMPLTLAYLETPRTGIWWLVRLDLAVTAIGSLGVLAALLASNLDHGDRWYRLAILGLLAFSFQTVVLDAIVWPSFFR